MVSLSSGQDEKMLRRLREDELARDIVEECRVQLMLKFRFLDLALWRMSLEPLRAGARYALATDAKRVAIDPPRVIARFGESFDELVRDYLHLVMHCIFRHPFDESHSDREAWSLACDIVVESVIVDMVGDRFPSEKDPDRIEVIDLIKMTGGSLLPAKVYTFVHNLMKTPNGYQFRGISPGVVNEWRDLFERDEHAAWPANNKSDEQSPVTQSDYEHVGDEDAGSLSGDDEMEMQQTGGMDDGSDLAEGEQPAPFPLEGEDDQDDESGEGEGDEQAGAEQENPQEGQPDEHDEVDELEREKQAWDDIAKEIEMNLETFSKEWGKESSSLIATLAVSNRKTYDYSEFLRKFTTITEEILLNQDEFDYIYYSYGMQLYGNMPLVEPLEYKETDRVREFVIAIDTSGSVRGSLVKSFIAHSFEIMKESESFATEVNVHIIQCDARIQADMKITDTKDVDALMEHFTLRGFGGTDFRPVFDYVDDLRKRGELTGMRGLIYFTDGLGCFPEKPPDYDTAFVFVNDEEKELPAVPPWAMKVVIDKAALERMQRC